MVKDGGDLCGLITVKMTQQQQIGLVFFGKYDVSAKYEVALPKEPGWSIKILFKRPQPSFIGAHLDQSYIGNKITISILVVDIYMITMKRFKKKNSFQSINESETTKKKISKIQLDDNK